MSFSGICKGPAGSEDLGCCSQMAVFHRRTPSSDLLYSSVEGLFKIVSIEEYPFHVDNRSDEQKILDDTIYFIRNYSMYCVEFAEEVPLEKLLDPLKKYSVSIEFLKDLLEQNGWTIAARERGPVVLIPERSDSDNSSGENWDDLEFSWNEQDNIENDWDLEPGPPSHRNDQIDEASNSRDDWSDDPAIIVIREEENSANEENNSSNEITRPSSKEINERLESTNKENEESVADIDKQNIAEGTSLSIKCTNPIENSSPLTFNFKEVLNNSTELPPQKLLHSDYESQSLSNKSEKIAVNEKLTRKTYRKSDTKFYGSSTDALEELGSLCSIYMESSRNDNSKTCFQDLSNLSFESTLSATSSLNSSKLDDLSSSSYSFKKPKVDGSFSTSSMNSSIQFRTVQEIEDELRRKYKKSKAEKEAEDSLHESDLWEGTNLIY